jgi:hypothetical protein
VSIPPIETNSPLVVNADAVLAFPVSLQSLQLVSGQGRKRPEILGRIKHIQFAKSLALDSLKPTHRFTAEEALSLGATERPDHRQKVYRFTLNVKRVRRRCFCSLDIRTYQVDQPVFPHCAPINIGFRRSLTSFGGFDRNPL